MIHPSCHRRLRPTETFEKLAKFRGAISGSRWRERDPLQVEIECVVMRFIQCCFFPDRISSGERTRIGNRRLCGCDRLGLLLQSAASDHCTSHPFDCSDTEELARRLREARSTTCPMWLLRPMQPPPLTGLHISLLSSSTPSSPVPAASQPANQQPVSRPCRCARHLNRRSDPHMRHTREWGRHHERAHLRPSPHHEPAPWPRI